jgi:hypothetical protein
MKVSEITGKRSSRKAIRRPFAGGVMRVDPGLASPARAAGDPLGET